LSTGVGLALLYVAATIYVDPSLQLLMYSAVAVLSVAAILLLWRERVRLKLSYFRMPSPVRGAIIGGLFWCFCAAWFLAFKSDTHHIVLSLTTIMFGLLAWPIEFGGWVFLWGYDPPLSILDSVPLNVLAGITLNAMLGAGLYCTMGRIKTIRSIDLRLSLRALMAFVAFASIALAIVRAYYDEAQVDGKVEFMACACGLTKATVADGKVTLTQPNHDAPAGTMIATIHLQDRSCTIARIRNDGTAGNVYDGLSVDHLGAKYDEYDFGYGPYPVYVVQADNWKRYPADAYARLKDFVYQGF